MTAIDLKQSFSLNKTARLLQTVAVTLQFNWIYYPAFFEILAQRRFHKLN